MDPFVWMGIALLVGWWLGVSAHPRTDDHEVRAEAKHLREMLFRHRSLLRHTESEMAAIHRSLREDRQALAFRLGEPQKLPALDSAECRVAAVQGRIAKALVESEAAVE